MKELIRKLTEENLKLKKQKEKEKQIKEVE